MTAKKSRNAELVRICIMSLASAFLIWLVGFFFQQDWLLGWMITTVDKDTWIQSNYNVWGTSVWGVATVLTAIWYGLGCLMPDRGPERNLQLRVIWSIFSFLTLIPTAMFAFLFGGGGVDWLAGGLCVLLFFGVGTVGYWVGTALNSPAPFYYIPPLALTLRSLVRLS
jgi:hypothetical protein